MLIAIILNIIFLFSDGILIKTAETGDYLNAVSITSDGKGNIYVLDAEGNEINKYDDKLILLKKIGKKGWSNGEFDSPTSIDGSSGLEIYVSDGKNYRIQRFDLNLSFISSVITNYETFQDKLKFQTPISTVYVNPYFYAIDGENNRIVAYQNLNQSSSNPVFSFGGFQSAQKPMLNPVKIVKDGYNNIYVLDAKMNSVLKYDNFGNYISCLELENIISICTFNNQLFILSGNQILVYDSKKNSMTDKILFAEKINSKNFKDFLVLTSTKIYILEKNKLNEFTLNN